MDTLIELNVDVTSLPTLEELVEYRVESMRVRVNGPAGGNPACSFKFRDNYDLVRFVNEWYGDKDVLDVPGVVKDST